MNQLYNSAPPNYMYLQLRHEVSVEHLHYGANPGWQVVGDVDFLEVHDVI